MSTISTHVLDTALGRPAADVPVRLERVAAPTKPGAGEVSVVADGRTDGDGRLRDLGPDDLEPGVYRLVFDTASYCAATGQTTFFPEISVVFTLAAPVSHHHVPVLLSPFAYSTYRGS